MASVTRCVEERLKLRVNREKSAVARPWQHEFLCGTTGSVAVPPPAMHPVAAVEGPWRRFQMLKKFGL